MRIFLTLILAMLFSASAAAFEAIHPFPDGTTGKWLYTVTGLRAHPAAGSLESAFTCTNMDKSKPANVGIEIYSHNGTLLTDISTANGMYTIMPGSTASFETNSIPALESERVIANMSVGQGVARIISSHSKIICSAFLMGDTENAPPIASLPVVKGTVQK